MSTTWAETSTEIISDALEHCQTLAAGETPNAEDHEMCMRALDGILKELPLHGFSWPQVTNTSVALTWDPADPAVVATPEDYFGVPVLKRADGAGNLLTLKRVAKPLFDSFQPSDTGNPTHYYVRPDLSLALYPEPEEDPGLTLSYQRIVPDTVIATVLDLPQSWTLGMGWWLASEISGKQGCTVEERQWIEAKAKIKRDMMLSWATDLGPIEITVEDGPHYPRGPLCL